MKAILIDSKKREIKEVEHEGNLKSVYDLLGCSMIDRFYANNECVYVDDEGMFNSPNIGFVYNGINYYGNGLIVGTDSTGKDFDTNMSFEKAKELFSFPECKHKKWLLNFFKEKDIELDELINGEMSLRELLMYISMSSEDVQDEIFRIMRNLDIFNGDVMPFLNHLTNSLEN